MFKYIKIIIPIFFIMFLCGCSTPIDEYPTNARYIPPYQNVETTYEYRYDLFYGFKEMPNIHTKNYPERYELQYCIKFNNNKTTLEWREVTKEEYEAFIKKEK